MSLHLEDQVIITLLCQKCYWDLTILKITNSALNVSVLW